MARDINVRIGAKEEVSKASRKAATAIRGLEKTSNSSARSIMQVWSQATIVVAGVIQAWNRVKRVADEAGKAYATQIKAEQKLTRAVSATGEALGLSADAMITQANALSQVTQFGDEVIISAQGVLAQFGKIGGDTMPRATEAVLDMAAALGTDASTAAERLGRALASPDEASRSLRSANILLTEAQEDAIDAFVESGDQAAAMGLILEQVERQYGGFAESVGQSSVGIIQRFENLKGDIQEKVGEIATALRVNLIETITPAFESILQWFNDNAGTIYAVFANIGPIMQATATYVVNLLRQTFAYGNYRELVTAIGSNVIEVLGTSISGIIGIFGAVFEAVAELAESSGMTTGELFASAFREGLGNLRESIQDWTEENITDPIREFFSRDRGRQPSSTSGGAGGVLDTYNFSTPGSELGIRQQGPSLGDITDTIITTFSDNIGGYIRTVVDSLRTAGTDISATIGDIYGDTTDEFKAAIQEIVDAGKVEFQKFRTQEGGAAAAAQQGRLFLGGESSLSAGGTGAIGANPFLAQASGASPASMLDNFFGAIDDTGAQVMEGFSGAAMSAMSGLNAAAAGAWAFQQILDGFLGALGTALNEVIKPLVDMLNSFGRTIAEMVLPVLNALYPIIATVANILNTLLAPFLARVSAQMSWLSSVLTMLDPILKAFATAMEVIQSPIRFLGEMLKWLGEKIRYAVGRLTFWTDADDVADPGAFGTALKAAAAVAFGEGLADRIDAIWDPQQADLSLDPIAGGSRGVGSSTTISRQPDQYFYFTFEGPNTFTGENGTAEFGQLIASSIQEYVQSGGRVSLEVAGA